jgi:anti-sigma-K factor RskA
MATTQGDDGSEREFEMILPWYVSGALDGESRMQVEDYLRKHGPSRALLESERALHSLIHEAAEQPQFEQGWAQLQQRIRAERRRPLGFLRGLSAHATVLAWRPAAVLAAAVIVAQGALLVAMWHRSDSESHPAAAIRSLDTSNSAILPLLRVTFLPDARESDIRFLLLGLGGKIVAGPSQLGDYYVEVPESKIAEAMVKLEASGVVMSIAQTTHRPEKE